ncbi:hypothetical protein [Bremerella sp. P1]|uniref:hypothetical protein n=1 Tax=Bremerella sp. P1 TaxID=3026424 RepID=UPI0023689AD5|nr:hypothetical protein [Bremerella sp. P1]WDI42191.1 hypothetical protein PSR63_27450 [Bremerella sp. P1]
MKDRRFRLGQWFSAVLVLSLPLLVVGCTANTGIELKGHVKTSTGEPVKGGTLVFSPIGDGGGKAASAEVQQDGNYAVSPGITTGKYRIVYSPPEPELTEEQRHDPTYTAPKPPYMGMIPKTDQAEINAQTTTIDVELVKRR